MYQLRKFARRNKAVVAATLVIFVGLAGAAAVATGFAVSESRQRDRAEREVEVGQAIIAFLAEMLSAMTARIALGRFTLQPNQRSM